MCVNVNGVKYLKEDMSIICNPSTDRQYAGLIAFAIIGLLQVFIFPFLIIIVLYIALFKNGVGWDNKKPVRFLHDMFQEDSWWFESFRLIRKVLLTLVARVMTVQGEQLVAAGLLLTVSQTVVSQFKPYREATANRIELLAQTVLILCMLIATLYFTEETATAIDSKAVAAGIVFVILFVTLLSYIIAISWAECCVPSMPNEDVRQEQTQADNGYLRRFSARLSLLFRRKSNAVEEIELQEPSGQITGPELNDFPEAPSQPGGAAIGASSSSAAEFEEELQRCTRGTHAHSLHNLDLR